MRKKKNPQDELITRGILNKELKKAFSIFFDRLEIYLSHRFKPLEDEMVKNAKFRDYAQKNFDAIFGKLDKIETELLILTHKYPRIFDQLDNHEKRIKNLEDEKLN